MAKAVSSKKPAAKKPKAETVTPESDLTDQQKQFCLEYAACLNGKRAAVEAGYSEKTAQEQSSRLLSIVKVRAEVDRLINERAMSANEVIGRLAQQARAEQSQFFSSAFGQAFFVDLKAMCEAGYGHLIKSVTHDGKTGQVTKIEFHDTQAALVHLGKAMSLFTENVNLSGAVTVEYVNDWRNAKNE